MKKNLDGVRLESGRYLSGGTPMVSKAVLLLSLYIGACVAADVASNAHAQSGLQRDGQYRDHAAEMALLLFLRDIRR